MKTDKTKNWTDSWKEQLDEYSVTPPPEVWEELSKELAPRPFLEFLGSADWAPEDNMTGGGSIGALIFIVS